MLVHCYYIIIRDFIGKFGKLNKLALATSILASDSLQLHNRAESHFFLHFLLIKDK